MIQANNQKAIASGNPDAVILGHNKMSDKTPDERRKMLGHRPKNGHNSGRGLSATTSSNHHRNLNDVPSKNWHDLGATRVKDQGDCGSCYAFAANSALEAEIWSKTGQYTRLSEQQAIDCTDNSYTNGYYYNYGCDGGWMEEVWWFHRESGAMADSDYPYVSGQTEDITTCQHNDSDVIARVESWELFDRDDPNIVNRMKQ